MPMTHDLDVARAERTERAAIENLMQLYVHDFSELWAGAARGEVGRDGRFEPYPLDAYWLRADHVPLLVRVRNQIAGFVLVNAESHSGQPVDRNVAEFFVLRKYRRAGVGVAAAHAVFSRYPGVWEAAVVRRNTGALAFWRRAVGGCAQARGFEEIDRTGPDWDGPVLRFWITP